MPRFRLHHALAAASPSCFAAQAARRSAGRTPPGRSEHRAPRGRSPAPPRQRAQHDEESDRRHRRPPPPGGCARRGVGARRAGTDQRDPPVDRRHADPPAGRLGHRASARPRRARSCAACGGDRIRVLTDGIGSFDVSASSADHAVAINPLTADRIEVLRGPAALPFGSSAIGGVVNVIDSRIPRRGRRRRSMPMLLLGYGSAADERSADLVAVECRSSAISCSTATAACRSSDDLRTGGHLLSDDLRAEAARQPRPRNPGARRPQGRTAQHQGRSRTMSPAALAYVDGAAQHRLLGHPPHRALRGPDSLSRSSPAPRPRRRGSTSSRPATTPAPKSRLSAAFFSQLRFRGGERVTIMTNSSPTARSGRASSPAAAKAGSTWSRPSATAGAAPAASRVWRGACSSRARRNSCPTAARSSSASSPCRASCAARCGSRPGSASSVAAHRQGRSRHRQSRRSSATFNALSLARPARPHDLGGGWKAGLNPVAQRSARRRSRNCSPAARTPAPRRSRSATPTSRPRRSVGVEASIKRAAGPVQLTATAYYSRFSNFIYQAADRRGGGRPAGLCLPPGQAPIITGSSSRPTPSSAHAMGIDWGVRGRRRRDPRHDQGVRPGAANPAAAPARRR